MTLLSPPVEAPIFDFDVDYLHRSRNKLHLQINYLYEAQTLSKLSKDFSSSSPSTKKHLENPSPLSTLAIAPAS